MKLSKKSIVWLTVAIIAIGGGGLWVYKQKTKPPTYETVQPTVQTINESIRVTGKIKAADDIALVFEKPGRVGKVAVKVGQTVKIGDTLASLGAADINANISEAAASLKSSRAALSRYQAAVDSANAKLAELERGSRPEEVTVSRAKVTKAEQAVTAAKQNVSNTKTTGEVALANLYAEIPNLLTKAFNEAEDAVNDKADQFFITSAGRPELSFTTTASDAKNLSETLMVESGSAVSTLLDLSLSNLTNTAAADMALTDADSKLATITKLLVSLANTINSANTLEESVATSYRIDVVAARTAITSVSTTLRTQRQNIAAQKSTNLQKLNAAESELKAAEQALQIAKDELNLVLAGATTEQLNSARAAVAEATANLQVQQAEVDRTAANLDRQYAERNKTVLIAPFDGVITAVDITAGEIVATTQPAISLISDAEYQIEANVAEAEIANIKIGDLAKFTLDAFDNSASHDATVVAIDPAETVTDGVATYKVTLLLNDKDLIAKPGMTADVEIITATAANALTLPIRAIKFGNPDTADLLKNGQKEAVTVTTGLRDRAGNIEILSGVSPTDTIILSETK